MESESVSTPQNSDQIIPPAIRERMGGDGRVQPRKAVYLNSLNYFRGIAILFIIAGHCFQLAGWHTDAVYEKVIVNLIKGGTAFFVFISGFLFHHLFAQKFRYQNFMKKKMSSVLTPYLAVCAPFLLYYVGFRQGGPHTELIYPVGSGFANDYLWPTWNYLASGRLFDAYWYIPFIMIMFALSPVFLKFLELPRRARLACLAGSMLIAMLIHRPVHNMAIIQSVVYYLPVYLLGMVISLDKDNVIKKLTGKEWILAGMMVALSIQQVVLYPEYANLHKEPLVWAGLDIMLVQKMLGCLLFYVFLNRFEYRRWSFLNLLAASSFALYFLHPILILFLKKTGILQISVFHQVPGILMWGFWTLAVTLLALGVASAIKRIFPKVSRRMIGW